jgi:hypothetical protein
LRAFVGRCDRLLTVYFTFAPLILHEADPAPQTQSSIPALKSNGCDILLCVIYACNFFDLSNFVSF